MVSVKIKIQGTYNSSFGDKFLKTYETHCALWTHARNYTAIRKLQIYVMHFHLTSVFRQNIPESEIHTNSKTAQQQTKCTTRYFVYVMTKHRNTHLKIFRILQNFLFFSAETTPKLIHHITELKTLKFQTLQTHNTQT